MMIWSVCLQYQRHHSGGKKRVFLKKALSQLEKENGKTAVMYTIEGIPRLI